MNSRSGSQATGKLSIDVGFIRVVCAGRRSAYGSDGGLGRVAEKLGTVADDSRGLNRRISPNSDRDTRTRIVATKEVIPRIKGIGRVVNGGRIRGNNIKLVPGAGASYG